jgi:hypothetical protein
VLLYDSNMCRVAALGVANVSNNQPPGSWYLAGAPVFGPGGEIYIAGYQENKIEVFLPDAASATGYTRGLGINTGEPGTTVTNSDGQVVSLAGPYGLMIDHRQRLVVSDALNNRVAVFLQPWHPENTSPRSPSNPSIGTQWQFAFELVARGNLSGAYLAMVRADRQGRWLTTSVVNDVVYVFETPELAVVEADADEVVATANGDVLRVRGNIVVPFGKSPLTDVIPTIELDTLEPLTNRASLGPAIGPKLAPPGTNIFEPAYEGTSITEIAEILPGHYAQVYWDFPVQSDGQAQFHISATKFTAAGDIVADAKTVIAESVPGTCVAPLLHAPVFNRPRFQTLDASTGVLADVYGDPLGITLAATQDVEGVREIRYQYTEGILNGLTGTLPGSSGTLTITHGFASSLFWTVRYRAVAMCGALSPWVTVRFKVDAEPPRLLFGPVTPAASGTDPDGRAWHSSPQVTMRVVATDDDTFSANVVFPDFPDVTNGMLDVLFTNEGVGQRQFIRVQDPVGNQFVEFTTRLTEINIDRTAPTLTLEPSVAPNAAGWYRTDVPFEAVAQDSLSGVKTLTSATGLTILPGATRHYVAGIMTHSGEGTGLTVSATTTDYANNSRTETSAPIRIDRTPPVAQSLTDATAVYTGHVTVALAATDTPATPGVTPSGVDKIYYSIAGAPSIEYTEPFTITTPGQTLVEFWARDIAGNEGSRRSAVYSVNSAPTATNTSFTTDEDVPVNVAVSASDADGEALNYVVITAPQHGTVVLNAGTGTGVYTPHLNYHGPDSFEVRVSDGRGGSTTAIVLITVIPVNDAPTAASLTATTIETTPVEITPVYSDVDAGDVLTVSLATGPGNVPTNGVVTQVGGVFIYTANPGFLGQDSFKYVVTDAAGASATATVVVTVRPRNQAPTCGSATASGAIWPPNHRQVPLTISGVVDPDGDPVSIVVTRILQDEPTLTIGDGNTPVDAGGIGTATPWVRAERMGPQSDRTYNNGRLYEIFFTASDGRGGSCEGKTTIGVPHDQGNGSTVIDNGCRWDSVASGPVLFCAPGAQPPVDARNKN